MAATFARRDPSSASESRDASVDTVPPVIRTLPRELSGLELDPEQAARRKAARIKRLNTVTIPTFRFLGFAILSLGIYLYLRFFERQADAGQVAAVYAGAAFVYSAVAMLTLRLLYRRVPGVKLALTFLAFDMVLQTLAIYLTGGENSWLVALLVLRVADQATSGQKRALFFAHFGVLCLLGLTAYLAFAEGRPIDWPRELSKAALLYGAGLWIAVSASPADRHRRQISEAIAATRRMVSELEAVARRLEEATVQAQAANHAKSQFLANVTHELRTPLNAIVGIADLLAHEELGPREAEYVGLLAKSADSLLHLVDDVLDFAKIEAGKLDMLPRPCRLEGVVEEVVDLLTPKARENEVALRCSLPEEPREAIVDPQRLRQVLLNLVGNAVKFTSQGSIDVRLTLLHLDRQGRARFEVRDTGIGISAEHQAGLFEPFTQVDASSTRRYGGTGLGLSVARRLVELMGGTIGVESRPGEGSTFWFEIPLEAAQSSGRHSEDRTPR